MNEITFEEYKRAIKSHFETKKIEGVYGSGDISNITPAQLRDLCRRISEMGLTKTDENTFRFFFNANKDEKLGRVIDNFGTGKLKSVISFLNGTKSDNPTRIELAAIITDFKPRPFKKFSQKRGTLEIVDEILSKNEDDEVDSIPQRLEVVTKVKGIVSDNESKKKIVVISVALIALFFIGYATKTIISPTKECMQWKIDHYEAVDCSNNKLGIGQWSDIVPIDPNIIELKKLDAKAKQVFFKNGKPVIWYFKNNGKIELFNQPGFHPETEKPLKPITDYIIEKYQLKRKE